MLKTIIKYVTYIHATNTTIMLTFKDMAMTLKFDLRHIRTWWNIETIEKKYHILTDCLQY